MNLRRLRRRCERLFTDQMQIPDPFDVRKLCRDLGIQRDKPIELLPMYLPEGPSGLWLSTDVADYVCYECHTSVLHQTHIILHEVGHIICGHIASSIDGDVSQLLLPDLDPAVIGRLLRRTHYTDSQEREAEMVATLILQRASWQGGSASNHISPQDTDVLKRIVRSLSQTPPESP